MTAETRMQERARQLKSCRERALVKEHAKACRHFAGHQRQQCVGMTVRTAAREAHFALLVSSDQWQMEAFRLQMQHARRVGRNKVLKEVPRQEFAHNPCILHTLSRVA